MIRSRLCIALAPLPFALVGCSNVSTPTHAAEHGGARRPSPAHLAVLTDAGELHILASPVGAPKVLAKQLGPGRIACPTGVPTVIFASAVEARRLHTGDGSSLQVTFGDVAHREQEPGAAALQLHGLEADSDAAGICVTLADGPALTAPHWVHVGVQFDGSESRVVRTCDGPPVGTPFEGCNLTLPSGVPLRLAGTKCEGYVTRASDSGRHVAVLIQGPCTGAGACVRNVLLVDQIERAVRAEVHGVDQGDPLRWEPGGERLLVGGTLVDPSGEATRLGSSACWTNE